MKRFYTILKAMESLGFAYTGEDVLITKNKKTGEILRRRKVLLFDARFKKIDFEEIKESFKAFGLRRLPYIGSCHALYAPEIQKVIIGE